jgi:hypothetical protein
MNRKGISQLGMALVEGAFKGAGKAPTKTQARYIDRTFRKSVDHAVKTGKKIGRIEAFAEMMYEVRNM